MAAKKAAKKAPARAAAKPKRAAKSYKPAKLSLEERLGALEAAAIENGWHMPHLHAAEDPADAK